MSSNSGRSATASSRSAGRRANSRNSLTTVFRWPTSRSMRATSSSRSGCSASASRSRPAYSSSPPSGLRTSWAMPASIICRRSSRARSASRDSSSVCASTPISSRVSIGMGASRSPRPSRAAACASRAMGREIRRDSHPVSSSTAASAARPANSIERRNAASAAGWSALPSTAMKPAMSPASPTAAYARLYGTPSCPTNSGDAVGVPRAARSISGRSASSSYACAPSGRAPDVSPRDSSSGLTASTRRTPSRVRAVSSRRLTLA